jgi:acyl carrier protein
MTSAVRPPVTDALRQLLAQVTGNEELLGIPPDTPLLGAGAGLDSLAATLLLRAVQRQFGVDVAGEDLNLSALATLGTLAEFIEQRTAG